MTTTPVRRSTPAARTARAAVVGVRRAVPAAVALDAVVSVLLVALAITLAAPAAAAEVVDYHPPVDAPVTDAFRPPPQPWLPGNRGIEYATAPGTPVRAAGRGVVTFAGPVAGTLHVTVTHPDGVRTSYSFLATVTVRAGSAVTEGVVVGTSGARLHVGARRGETYIDPASLWGDDGPPWVRLAPLDGSGGRRRGPADGAGPVGPAVRGGPVPPDQGRWWRPGGLW